MAIWKLGKNFMYLKRQTQVGTLLFDKASTKILAEYFDYYNFFLVENAVEFSKNSRINKYVIVLKEDKSSSFGLIYSLKLIKLKTLKTYIKTNLTYSFFIFFKSFARAPIFF